jgi:hydroxymethylbilane synthase
LKIVIGSRGSKLALWQSEWAKAQLSLAHEGLGVDIEVIRTVGDANLSASFSEIGTKGLFTREVDKALLAGRTDLSVHSLKDLPTTLPRGLSLTAVSPRADVRDALISQTGLSLGDLPRNARVATSSLRRQSLLRSERSDLDLLPLRGNIDTRIKKLESEGLDAIVLAGAGLQRLGLDSHITELLDANRFTPAAAQGVMGIVSRADDDRVAALLAVIEDADARFAVTAERAALAELGGGCRIPFGAWARLENDTFVLDGVVVHPERGNPVRAQIRGVTGQAYEMGLELAATLRDGGGAEILEEVLA